MGTRKISDDFNGEKPDDLGELTARLQAAEAKVADLEMALQVREHLTDTIFNIITDHVFLVSEDGTFLEYWGQERDAFQPPEYFLGKKINEIMPPDLAPELMRSIGQALATGESQILEYELFIHTGNRDYETRMVSCTSDTVVAFTRDITDRKRAESKLQTTEARMRLITDSVPVLITYVDIDGSIRFSSATHGKWLARSPEDLIGKQFEEILQPEMVQTIQPYVKRVLAGEFQDFELKNSYPDGKERVVHNTYIPDIGPDGMVRGFSVMSEDITERRHAEEVLQRSEKKFKGLAEGSVQGLVVHRGGNLIFANQAYADTYGYQDPAEILALDSIEYVNVPEEREWLRERGAARLRGEDMPDSYESKGLKKDGTVIQVSTLNSIIEWDGESAILTTLYDITDRKRAEESLLENRNLLQSMIDTLPFRISVKDSEGKYQVINRSIAVDRGLMKEEMIGQTIATYQSVMKPEWVQDIEEMDRLVLGEGIMTGPYEFDVLLPEGNTQKRSLSKFPLKDATDATVGIITWSEDITDRKRVEESLLENRNLLQSMIDTLPFWMSVKDSEGKYLVVNHSMAKDRGLRKEELIGRNIRVMHEEMVPGWVLKMEELDRFVLKSGLKTRLFEYEAILLDGRVQKRHLSKFPLKDAAGAIVGVITWSEDITERKRAEEEMRRTRISINQASDTLFWVDSSGKFIDVNDSACQSLGYTRAEFSGMGTWDISFPPEGVQEDYSSTHFPERFEVIKKIGSLTFSTVHRRKNGTTFPVEITANFVQFDGKEFICGIARDVSERMKAEQALLESEKKYRSLFEYANDGIFIIDLSTLRFLDANRIGLKQLGYTREELLQLSVFEISPPEDQSVIEHRSRKLIEEGSLIFSTLYMRKDGLQLPVEVSTQIVEYGGRQVFLSFIRDITERKLGEVALRQSEERMRFVLESAADGIFITDQDGKIEMINPAAKEIFGYSGEELKNRNISTLVPPECREKHEKGMVQVREGELDNSPSTLEVVGLHKDGTRLTLSITISEFMLGNNRKFTGIVRDITTKKEAEEKLRNSERQLRHAQEIAHLGYWERDLDTNRIEWSEETYRIYGVDPEEFEPKFEILKAFVHPSDRELINGLKRIEEGKSNYHDEYRIIRSDGSIRDVHTRGELIRDEEGRPRKLMGAIQDITDMKKVEEDLRASETRYRSVVEAMSEGVVLRLPDGTISTCNVSAEHILGVTIDQLAGRIPIDPRWHFIHPDGSVITDDEHPSIAPLWTGNPFSNVLMGVHKPDGQLTWISVNSQPVFQDEAENPVAVVTTLTDITERRRAEEERQRLITAIEQTIEGVVITDEEGTIQYVNSAFERITGYSRDEAIGNNPSLLKSGKQDREFFRGMWEVISKGETWEGILFNRKKDGTFYEEEMNISPISDGSGKIVNFIAVKRDITERRQAEERIRLQEQQLIQADKMASLGILVSGVAHEINNPNSFITFNAPILTHIWNDAMPILKHHYEESGDFTLASLPYEKAAEAVPKLLSGISRGATRIKNIVGNLKDFVRQDQSGEFQPIQFNAVLESAVTLLSNEINKRTKHFSVEYGADLPLALGDFQKLEQVMINLISNSCQALPDLEKAVRVQTDFDADSGTVRLTVADEGVGISPENLSKIMDPFFTTKRDSGGTGLGLSVSYSIIEEHGGKLEFSSTQGEGTTAILSLPFIHVT